MILFMSDDNGELYTGEMVDDPEHFTAYEVSESFTLTAEECCGGHGSIIEILLLAGKAQLIGKVVNA